MARFNLYDVVSGSTTLFTGALVNGAAEEEQIPGIRFDGKSQVVDVCVKSRQQLAWQVEMLKGDDIVSSFRFEEDDATVKVIDGVTWYFYYEQVNWMSPRVIPDYESAFALRNMSSTAKTAGVNGAVELRIRFQL